MVTGLMVTSGPTSKNWWTDVDERPAANGGSESLYSLAQLEGGMDVLAVDFLAQMPTAIQILLILVFSFVAAKVIESIGYFILQSCTVI